MNNHRKLMVVVALVPRHRVDEGERLHREAQPRELLAEPLAHCGFAV